MAISEYDIDVADKMLGLNLMEVYKFISEVMGTTASDIEELKKVCNDLKKKYCKDNSESDQISDIIESNLVPMASAIVGLSIYEIWANAVKKKMSKSKFFKLFKIEEDLENEDYIALLAQIAEEYEGFENIECDDLIDICEEYGITSDIEDDDYDEIIEKISDMNIPEFEED